MHPVDTGKAYDQLATIWNSDSFNRLNGIKQHQRALKFCKNMGNALDIGCGCNGRFIDLLAAKGLQPEGLDVSGEMIRLAQLRHPHYSFYHADICQFTLPKTYDFITAWDSIWHIPLTQQRQVITKIIAGLNPGGIFIFSFGGVASEGEHSNNVMGPEVYYSTLGTQGFLSLLLQLGCQIKHLEYDQHPELHTYLIVEKA